MEIEGSHKVPYNIVSERLQEYGVGIFNVLTTKSSLKKAIKKNLILVNGKVATTGTYIKGGEIIELKKGNIPQSRKKLRLDLEIIYEDEYLAIINKPPGILVSGNSFKTIANGLAQNLKPSMVKDATSPKPVHRLDYPTTGLLLIGKTASSIVQLGNLFEYRKVNKIYHAVTIGVMEENGVINFRLEDKTAISNFTVMQTVDSQRFKCLNLVKLTPKTGRKHQLRRHLAQLGNPILGDATYSPENLILKGKGLYLHASSLEFEHPATKKIIHVNNKLPLKFSKIFRNCPD